jgi:hypothetical protein
LWQQSCDIVSYQCICLTWHGGSMWDFRGLLRISLEINCS